jgi:hypothetical protein
LRRHYSDADFFPEVGAELSVLELPFETPDEVFFAH